MNPFQAREIWPPGTVVDRKYVVRSTLGRGGFGTVYLVNHRVLGHDYVIKRLHSQFAEDPRFIDRFVREAQAIAKLKGCPQIVEVFDMTQTEDGQLILVMEYMPGGDLASLVQKEGRLSVADTIWHARQIAEGLKAAHAAGFEHRDVKPQNILLGVDQKVTKLTDFGIVTDRDSARTTSVMRGGSEGFAAPEQWQFGGKHLDGRTDIYALGATTYWMLTGRLPYGELDLRDWVIAIQSGPPPSLSTIRRDVPAGLDRLVLQMLEVDREGRPRDMGMVIESLKECAAPALHRETAVEFPAQPKRQETIVEPAPLPRRTPEPGPAGPAIHVVALRGHMRLVNSAEFSKGGERIVTSSWDGTARVWDPAGKEIARLEGHSGNVSSAQFSPDGRRAVTASFDKTASVWDAATGELIVRLVGHTGAVRSAEFSPDGRQVVTASEDTTARLWDAADGEMIFKLEGHFFWVNSAQFSPDGQRIVTARDDSVARVWSGATGMLVVKLEGHTKSVSGAQYSSDGLWILTASKDKTARVWNAATGALIAKLEGHADAVNSARFSSDGQRVVTTSKDKTARTWNAATGGLIARLEGHSDSVDSAQFSSDGLWIVTGSRDKTARVWNSSTGELVVKLVGHTGEINGAGFSPDGRRALTSSADGTARVWTLGA